MPVRQKVSYSNSWELNKFSTAKDFIKQLLDSIASSVHPNYYDAELAKQIDGIRLTIGTYENSKDNKSKKLIATAIVELLDDLDYSCDAVPVAAELGLLEAKDWFIKLSKKKITEIRKIKTNKYTNALICFIIYASKDNSLINILKQITLESELLPNELFTASFNLSENDPNFILDNIEKYFTKLISERNKESDKLSDIAFMTSGIFKKYGDSYCIELAKRFKESLPKEYQVLFYKELAQNPTPRFKPYLEDLKKILKIPE